MQLTYHEYEKVLCAVEDLATKQLTIGLDSYRKEVLHILYNVFGYRYSLFWISDGNHLIDPILLNIEKQSLIEYENHYKKQDFLQPFNVKHKKRIQTLNDVVPFSKYLQTEYYNSFMKKYLFLDELAIYLEHNGEIVGGIGILRNRDETRFTLKDVSMLNYLVKQIESGFNIHRNIANNIIKKIGLTEREQEIVYYLEKGLKNKEISKILFVTEHTVKKHLQNLFLKTGTNNRTELLYRLKYMK